MKSTNNRRKFAGAFLAACMMMGSMFMFSNAQAEVGLFGKKDREIVGGSCKGEGSCIIVINGSTHTDEHALDRVVYN